MPFKITMLILLISCLTSCQQVSRLRFKFSGSQVPRNPREEVIFDYFLALSEKRYEDAYRMRAGSDLSSVESAASFTERHLKDHASLATSISIGSEDKSEGEADECIATYTVYAFSSSSTSLTSGLVSTVSKADHPGVCRIAYNSAFGSVP